MDRQCNEPLLTRYYLFLKERKYFPFNVFLHKFHNGDHGDVHDHPWPYATLILKGGYYEYTPNFKNGLMVSETKHWRGPGHWRVCSANSYHRIELIPGITVKGIDISEYAIENAIEDMKPHVQVGNALSLPFDDKSFDVIISVTTLHNLERDECAIALQEIERVCRKGAFITVDAYRNEEEKERMYNWNLTAKTIMSVEEWKVFFKQVWYTGDYYWFIP